MTTTVYFSYVGTCNDRFDQEYYCTTHLPNVMEAWSAYGLLNAQAFFPPSISEQLGTLAICEATFVDEASVQNAFDAPSTPAIVADMVNFTDLPLQRTRSVTW